MKNILAILCLAINLLNADFIRDDNLSVVTDTSTNLMWQDDLNVNNKIWEEAIKYCEDLTLANYNNWRLPNIRELFTLIDFKQEKGRSLSFENIKDSKYLSSTTKANSNESVFIINTFSLSSESKLKTEAIYIKCVRNKN